MDNTDIQPLTGKLQIGPQGFVHQGGQNRTRLRFDPLQNGLKLKAGADETPPMIVDLYVFELHRGGPRDGVQGLSGCIGDKVEVEAVRGHVHRIAGISRAAIPLVAGAGEQPGITGTIDGTRDN